MKDKNKSSDTWYRLQDTHREVADNTVEVIKPILPVPLFPKCVRIIKNTGYLFNIMFLFDRWTLKTFLKDKHTALVHVNTLPF